MAKVRAPFPLISDITLVTCVNRGIHDPAEQEEIINRVRNSVVRARSKDLKNDAIIEMIKASFPVRRGA